MRDTGAGSPDAGDLIGVEMDAVRVPDIWAEPAELLDDIEGAGTEAGQAVPLFGESLSEVGVKPEAETAGQIGRADHEL